MSILSSIIVLFTIVSGVVKCDSNATCIFPAFVRGVWYNRDEGPIEVTENRFPPGYGQCVNSHVNIGEEFVDASGRDTKNGDVHFYLFKEENDPTCYRCFKLEENEAQNDFLRFY